MASAVDRAVLFIDGNNWYHGLKAAGIADPARLDYVKIASKLTGAARSWVGSRYYIGRVPQAWSPQLAADQTRFLAAFTSADTRHSVYFGRLEQRQVRSEAAHELLAYLGALPTKIDPVVYRELTNLGARHRTSTTQVEKAVDVMLAVDLVIMAQRDEFDSAYILSADGDYTHAATFVRSLGKKVYAAAMTNGAQLAAAVNTFIRLRSDWFADCYQ